MVSIAEINNPIHARIDYDNVVDIRAKASACHASQGGKEQARGIQKWLQKLFRSTELFMQAYPVPSNRKIAADLFVGIKS